MPDYSVVGKRVSRVDALAKVTGKAIYAADINLPNMLYGKVLWSPYPHARIRRLDLTKALALEGVMAIITAADVPGQKDEEEYFRRTTHSGGGGDKYQPCRRSPGTD
jgi:CO/xanthine dehydrogenase Mo-binding subunit